MYYSHRMAERLLWGLALILNLIVFSGIVRHGL
jgi:hypothetical protein